MIYVKITKSGEHRDGSPRLKVEFEKQDIEQYRLKEGQEVAIIKVKRKG